MSRQFVTIQNRKSRSVGGLVSLLLLHALATGCASQGEQELRFYGLEGARNFRDFGGYATTVGSQIAWGKLFRSNQPAGMTSADYQTVNSLELATVFDFRTAEEREAGPTRWQGTPMPEFVLLPMGSTERLRELDILVEAAIADEDTDSLRAVGEEIYRRVPVEYADEFAQLLRSLADEQSIPILIHCHAGKDRTGVGAALILSLLGVPRETIMADYLYSNDRLLTDGVERTPIEQLYWGVEAEWLQASFASIEAQYGSVDNYIDVALGIDAKTRDAIRKNLLRD